MSRKVNNLRKRMRTDKQKSELQGRTIVELSRKARESDKLINQLSRRLSYFDNNPASIVVSRDRDYRCQTFTFTVAISEREVIYSKDKPDMLAVMQHKVNAAIEKLFLDLVQTGGRDERVPYFSAPVPVGNWGQHTSERG